MKQRCHKCRQTIDTTGLAGMTVECPRCGARVAAHDKSIPMKPKVIGPTIRLSKLQRLAVQAGLLLFGATLFLGMAIYMMNMARNIKPLQPHTTATAPK